MGLDLIKREGFKLIEIDSIIEVFTNEDIDKILNEDSKRVISITYICQLVFYLLLKVFLAMNFLEIFRALQNNLTLKTILEAIEYQNHVSTKEFILYVYNEDKKV